MSQHQRLAWSDELFTGTSGSLPHRVAVMLLLLYAQTFIRAVTLHISAIDDGNAGMRITLGHHPTGVPEPFASLLGARLATRSTLRPGAGPAPGVADDWQSTQEAILLDDAARADGERMIIGLGEIPV